MAAALQVDPARLLPAEAAEIFELRADRAAGIRGRSRLSEIAEISKRYNAALASAAERIAQEDEAARRAALPAVDVAAIAARRAARLAAR